MRAHYARTQSWGAAPAGPLASGWGTPPPLDHPARQGVLRLPGPPGRRLRQHTMHAESQMKYNEILLPFHCYFRCYVIAISLLIHC